MFTNLLAQKRIRPVAVALGFCLVWFGVQLAEAAQTAEVTTTIAPLRDGPGGNFDVLKKLPQGSKVQISNYPRQGFFKARIFDGTVGWIDASKLTVTGSVPIVKPKATPIPLPTTVVAVPIQKAVASKNAKVKAASPVPAPSLLPVVTDAPPTLDLDVLDTEVK